MTAQYVAALITYLMLVLLVISRWKTLSRRDRTIAIVGVVVSTVLLVGTVVASIVNSMQNGVLL